MGRRFPRRYGGYRSQQIQVREPEQRTEHATRVMGYGSTNISRYDD